MSNSKRENDGEYPASRPSKSTWVWGGALLVVALVAIFLLPKIASAINTAVVWSQSKGSTITLIFILTFMFVSSGVPVPGFMFLVFAVGLLYGVWAGFFLAYFGSFVFTSFWFLVYRNCCGKDVVKMFGEQSERNKLWMELAERDGIRIVTLVKLLPFGGGGLANVSFALLTKVTYCDFAIGLSIAHVKFLLYTFVSSSAGSLSTMNADGKGSKEHQQRFHTMRVIMSILAGCVLVGLIFWGCITYQEIEKQVDDMQKQRASGVPSETSSLLGDGTKDDKEGGEAQSV